MAAEVGFENGFTVISPCGREWFVPEAAVAKDYAEFLVENDHLSMDDAMAQVRASPEFIETWFCEQIIWAEVERYGVQTKVASDGQIKRALDYYRDNPASGPAQNYRKEKVKF